jgi:magnesium transporter
MPARHHPTVSETLLRAVPVFPSDATVAHARHSIEHRSDWESVTYVYLTDKRGALACVLSIKELLNASPDASLASICHNNPVSVGPHTSQERAAILAIHHGIKAIPVVGRGGKLLGVFGTDAILNVLQHAGIDDAIRFQGIHVEHRGLLDVLHGRLSVLFRRRLPWLLVGLGGGFLSAAIARGYEGFLREVIELSFFTPAVVYMGAAVGGQTQALFLRAITIGEVRVGRFLVREFAINAMLGLLIGALTFIVASLTFPHDVVPLIVAIAMCLTVSVSGIVAVLIVSALARRKKGDPALGAGPFATIVQDLVSLSLYLGVASIVLSATAK